MFYTHLFIEEELPKKGGVVPLELLKALRSSSLSKEMMPRRHQHHGLFMTWVDKGKTEQRLLSKAKDK